MSAITDLLENFSAEADPLIPVKGILVSRDPSSAPSYIYVGNAESVSDLHAEHSEPVHKGPATPFQEIISSAFTRSGADLYSLDLQLSALPGMKRFKCGMVVRSLSEDGRPFIGMDHSPESLAAGLEELFPKDYIAVLDDAVYVMRTSDEIIPEFQIGETGEFEAFLEKKSAYAIKGGSSQWLKGLRVLYNQCVQTLPIAVTVRFGSEAKKRVLNYSRYAFYYTVYLAEHSGKGRMGSGDVVYLCDAAVLTLTRYDRSFNSDLRDTLFIYLMKDRSISEAARELHVHRNTVIYKLNQIKALIGDKMDDPYVRHSLISSCMIIRYIENYRKREVDLPPLDRSLLKKNL